VLVHNFLLEIVVLLVPELQGKEMLEVLEATVFRFIHPAAVAVELVQ
jgi:hypothetical protein